MRNSPLALIISALLITVPSLVSGRTLEVENQQPITLGMKTPVVLKVTSPATGCTFLGRLVQRADGGQKEWLLRADQRACRRSAQGEMEFSQVQALVTLPMLPVPRNTKLLLTIRSAAHRK